MLRRLLTVALCLAAPSGLPAAAAAEVIGSDLGEDGPAAGCAVADGCVVVQERIAGRYVEVGPENAVITEWGTRGARGPMALRVYEQRPDVDFTPGELHAEEVGESDEETGDGSIQGFLTQIPVMRGDYIALVLADNGSFSYRRQPPPATLAFRVANLDVVDSTSPQALELFLQARVEPDVDADGLGDETQDPCVGCPEPLPADPYAAIRAKGPTVSIAARARASRRGVVPVRLRNPYAFELTGRLTLTVAGKRAGAARYELPASASRAVRVKLAHGALRRLERRGSLRAVGSATVTAAEGPTGRVKRKLGLLAARTRSGRR